MNDVRPAKACIASFWGSLALFAAPASADERPVIHSGMEAPGVVEAWLDSDEGQARREVPLSALRTKPDVWVAGQAAVTACSGPPTDMGDVRQLRESVRGLVAYLRMEEALQAFSRLDPLLACLSEPVDAQLAAELYRLRGYTHMLDNDAQSAAQSFRLALSFAPGLEWDEQYSRKYGAELLERIRSEAASGGVSLEVLPAVHGAVTTVGGRPSSQLLPGTHLVQVQATTTRSMWVRAESKTGAVSLVIPSLLAANSLQDWDQPSVQTMWRTLVQASPMQAGAVELIANGHVQLLEPGATNWETTARLRGGGTGDPRARRVAATAWYGSAGLSIMGGGALLAVASNRMGELEESARADLLSPGEAETTRREINRSLLLGYSLIGVGVGVGGVGALVMKGTAGGGGRLEWVGTW